MRAKKKGKMKNENKFYKRFLIPTESPPSGRSSLVAQVLFWSHIGNFRQHIQRASAGISGGQWVCSNFVSLKCLVQFVRASVPDIVETNLTESKLTEVSPVSALPA